ncbi:MAG: hypothetical protein J6Y89_09280 [Lachnospiraceae bacterium]|nr:hypothetical protein [Lachnospiraceae bacterium]
MEFKKSTVAIDPVVIKGSVGTPIDTRIKLTMDSAFFSEYIDKGTDVSDWFPGRGVSAADGRARQLPVGISATLDCDIVPGMNTATIRLTGTPLYKSNNYLVVLVPGKYVSGNYGYGWYSYYSVESEMLETCCFDISGPADEPVYAAFDNVRYEVYAGTNLASDSSSNYRGSTYYYTGSNSSRDWANSLMAGFTVYNASRVFNDSWKPMNAFVSVTGAIKYAEPGEEIEYEGREDVIIYAKNASGQTVTNAAINMTQEKLITTVDYKCYRIWTGATDKKPASGVQIINAAARAEAVTSGAFTLSGGKLKLGKNFEAYNTEKGKWGGLPKITSSCTIQIRIKATAKGGKESDTTYATSAPMKLVVTFGIVDENNNKSGVVSADVKIE